ncbi:hypothetical protein F8388_009031 [Cannabis sativa]|uniref:Zinc finger protein n=1 Tax=Cannabis sativa TaxID=3483 RepID=A0A7J6G5P4_CANSA|nr:hypothetical protein G4B88_022980 [Cannabis sativa]KAF4383000.1 hypothetical protein F8388_009031 [Cannabis sativa]
MADEPNLCVKGCGFYGRAEDRNMCSKCYNEFLKNEIISKSISKIHSDENDDAISESLCDQLKDLKITTNRCKDCNKKVGLTGFSCRCGNVYCSRHRLPEQHACTYDFKGAARKNLKLPLICGEKLKKIL